MKKVFVGKCIKFYEPMSCFKGMINVLVLVKRIDVVWIVSDISMNVKMHIRQRIHGCYDVIIGPSTDMTPKYKDTRFTQRHNISAK